MTGLFRFGDFLLDADNRQIVGPAGPVELSGRYFDALALLLREAGKLVPKDRFMDEVWRGIPVTDEALTQCIRTVRRLLGDEAGNPRFIETVPKHGYRFIAPVEMGAAEEERRPAPPTLVSPSVGVQIGLAGTVGGGLAGIFGGLFYGFGGAGEGSGGLSTLLVLLCINVTVALVGGAAVGFGIALATNRFGRAGPASIIGGAVGGLVVGAIVKLIAVDAFALVVGQAPGNITGAPEGALLGAAVGVGAWLAGNGGRRWSTAVAGAIGAVGGLAVAAVGGRLMGGSLDTLATHLPGSKLRLDPIGGLFGEPGFGPITQFGTAAIEGLVFASCVVGAMAFARRRLTGGSDAGLP